MFLSAFFERLPKLSIIPMLFKSFVSRSAKYTLIYGSLASIIIFMLWFNTCSIVFMLGVVFDVALDRMKENAG